LHFLSLLRVTNERYCTRPSQGAGRACQAWFELGSALRCTAPCNDKSVWTKVRANCGSKSLNGKDTNPQTLPQTALCLVPRPWLGLWLHGAADHQPSPQAWLRACDCERARREESPPKNHCKVTNIFPTSQSVELTLQVFECEGEHHRVVSWSASEMRFSPSGRCKTE
jgi:hypothetical protein